MADSVKPWAPGTYPPARRSDHVDVYKSAAKGDVRVPDPYNWLEQDTEETEKWVTAQADYTSQFLEQNSDRSKLEDGIRANTDYARFDAPSWQHDKRWYWFYNTGLQAQSVLYRSPDKALPDLSKVTGPGGEVFFDPNLLSEDGTVSLAALSWSRSGAHFAYGLSQSGSDSFTIYIRPTSAPLAEKDGKRPSHDDGRLPDEIKRVKFSGITWTHDSKGFFYQRFPLKETSDVSTSGDKPIEVESDLNAELCYHRVGTHQSEDIVVMKDPENPKRVWGTGISEVDGRYLELHVTEDTSRKNLLWICDLHENEVGPNMKWIKLVDTYEASYYILGNNGTELFLMTNKDAPHYKVVKTDLAHDHSKFENFIEEDKGALLKDARFVNGDKLAVIYQRDVKDEIWLCDSAVGPELRRLDINFVGTANVSGRRTLSGFFVTLTGFTTPGAIFRYDFDKEESQRYLLWRQVVVEGINPDEFVAKQVWFESKDGTKVPMFVVRHKETPLDGTAPAIQYGYGGFSISSTPFFSPSIMTFLKAYGAILAVVNIRGGGEFGEDWHLAGTKERKVNCFDDFIAATEYLVEHKYAGKGLVTINGGSNGGLLVAACVNRAPEGTFGAAVAEVGVMDLLKFHKFTIGYAWTSDYGCADDPEAFDYIYPISPIHNVPTDKILPPTLLLTADHDDRVVPLHSFKLAATLQHTLPQNPHPLLVRIQKKAGHGAGKSTEQKIKESADKWGFVAQTLGLKLRH